MSPPLLFITLWAVLLITFMIVRPAPYSSSFWWLLGSAMLSGGLYMLVSHRENTRTQRATLRWLNRISELVDVHDYVDDGHLPEFLDEDERRKVIDELERMPAGSRSLRRALEIVSPELADDQ